MRLVELASGALRILQTEFVARWLRLFGRKRSDPVTLVAAEPLAEAAAVPEAIAPEPAAPEPAAAPADEQDAPEQVASSPLPVPEPEAGPGNDRSPGEFYFRETILDQLDRYFVYLRRMRHQDPDAYALYRQLGGTRHPDRQQGALPPRPRYPLPLVEADTPRHHPHAVLLPGPRGDGHRNGRTKRIFHIVRPHRRVRAGGQESSVRMHFRGQREFVWNGYRVRISVPGWHHANMAEIAAAFHDRAKDEPREAGTLSMEQLGAEIRKKTRSGTGELPLSQPGRKTPEARV